jgi:conjugal transfer pilus assembly protein TraI
MNFSARHPSALFDELGSELFSTLLSASQAGEEIFRYNYLPLLEKAAYWLQELPLERKTYAERGGALKFTLLSSLGTLRMCSGVIFAPSSDSEHRRLVEPQYRFAAFVASLCTVPLIVHHNVAVTVNGSPWDPFFGQGLYSALTERVGSAQYQVEWRPETHERPSAALAVLLISWLLSDVKWAQFDRTVLRSMVEAINPAGIQAPSESALSRVVRVGHEKAREAALQRAALRFTPNSTVENADELGQAIVRFTPGTPAQGAGDVAPVTSPVSVVATDVATTAVPAVQPVDIPKVIRQWAEVVRSRDEYQSDIQPFESDLVQVFKPPLSFATTPSALKEVLERANLIHTVVQKPPSLILRKPMRDLLFPSGVPANYPVREVAA